MGDYKRIMALGSWLQRYISPTLSPYGIEKLVDDALILLNIDHVRSDSDPVVNAMITLLEEHDLRSDYKKHETEWLIDTVQKYSAVVMGDIPQADSPEELRWDINMSLVFFLGIIENIKDLQEHKDTPWENLLLTSAKRYTHKESTQPLLLEEYNKIREELVMKSRKIAIVNKMVYPDTDIREEWVRFPAMVSRIFINFLREGGRDYCGLCKNCGMFILAERKGQRQFCGGACRIAYKRKMDKK